MLDPVTEIKSRLQIEELVGQYVQLKKVGRNFRGLCPFHNEKTPSFYVSVERQMAYCFGCKKGGDVFNFIQEIEGFEFKDALSFLAEKVGIILPERSGTSAAPGGASSEKKRLLELHKAATEYFVSQLQSEPSVFDYIRKRNIADCALCLCEFWQIPCGFLFAAKRRQKKPFGKNALRRTREYRRGAETRERVHYSHRPFR